MTGLNAPYGARCFLTLNWGPLAQLGLPRLNAPYGARCFLTEVLDGYVLLTNEDVLMHLMVLGAF